MRKIVAAIMSVAFLFTAAGQKISLGIEAGLSLATVHEHYWGNSKHGDNKPGIIAGVTGSIPIKGFAFQPAINFVQKGFKHNISGYGFTLSDEMSINYIELPFNFLYYHRVSALQLFVGTGPSVAFAVSGKEKINEYGNLRDYTFQFGNNVDKDDLRRSDFGANFLLGAKWQKIFLYVNYNFGVSSLIPGGNEEGSLTNRYLGFVLGYMPWSISKSINSP